MRDIWHCPPSEFREQKLSDYYKAIQIMSVEGKVQARKSQKKN